jgi:hypothetical protein
MEGQLNLLTRVHRSGALAELEKQVREKPLLGQVYLALDGIRTQDEIVEFLGEHGITTSRPTVWRRIDDLEKKLGIATFVRSEPSIIFRQSVEAESTLGASEAIRKLLAEMGKRVPPAPKRPRR